MKQPFLYIAYQLLIESELALPELLATGRSDSVADVRICQGSVGAPDADGRQQVGPFAWCKANELWLEIPGIGRFLARLGRMIIVETDPATAPESVRLFLLGSVLGALLAQRGLLVLHGNAVRIGDHCLVCIGPSGVGKSTLAAGFMKRGFKVLADDVVPIDRDNRALPGFPRVKLWQDSASRLDVDTSVLRRLRPHMEKFNCPIGEHFETQAIPVRWIYLLTTHPGEQVQFTEVSGVQRFTCLRANSYRLRFLNEPAPQAEHLLQCGKLASDVSLRRVSRPVAGFEVDGVIDAILADIQAQA
jgi:hypothetical protein